MKRNLIATFGFAVGMLFAATGALAAGPFGGGGWQRSSGGGSSDRGNGGSSFHWAPSAQMPRANSESMPARAFSAPAMSFPRSEPQRSFSMPAAPFSRTDGIFSGPERTFSRPETQRAFSVPVAPFSRRTLSPPTSSFSMPSGTFSRPGMRVPPSSFRSNPRGDSPRVVDSPGAAVSRTFGTPGWHDRSWGGWHNRDRDRDGDRDGFHRRHRDRDFGLFFGFGFGFPFFDYPFYPYYYGYPYSYYYPPSYAYPYDYPYDYPYYDVPAPSGGSYGTESGNYGKSDLPETDLAVRRVGKDTLRVTWVGGAQNVSLVEFALLDKEGASLSVIEVDEPPFIATFTDSPDAVSVAAKVYYSDGKTKVVTIPLKGGRSVQPYRPTKPQAQEGY